MKPPAAGTRATASVFQKGCKPMTTKHNRAVPASKKIGLRRHQGHDPLLFFVDPDTREPALSSVSERTAAALEAYCRASVEEALFTFAYFKRMIVEGPVHA
jgi:hypothetical protein